jgi:geranylgeranyl pyrophosphate synthase
MIAKEIAEIVMKLENYLQICQKRVNQQLDIILPLASKQPEKLHTAMRYAVFNGGKRLRSAFVYAIGETLGAQKTVLDQCSAAVELVHAFSLIHDDLPALDNDNLRRGKLSCHKKFGEALAILAGDALMALAFESLANIDQRIISANISLKMIEIMSHCIGSCGMAGGEAMDVASQHATISLEKLVLIYQLKTSHLLCVGVILGALAARCDDRKVLTNLKKFAMNLGLAFQIHDDILGVTTDTEILGKPQGSDMINCKPTLSQMLGLDNANKKKQEYFERAVSYLTKAGIHNETVRRLGEFMISRKF